MGTIITDERLPYPHYSDHWFSEERLIWSSSKVKKNDHKLTCCYTDRLTTEDYDKFYAVRDKVNEIVPTETARWHQNFVELFFERRYDLIEILACHHARGYPIWIYGLVKKTN